MCRRGTRTCIYNLDFQNKKFSYAFFVVKNMPLYVNIAQIKPKYLKYDLAINPSFDLKFSLYV